MRIAWLVLASALIVGATGCSNDDSPLTSRLVRAADLPGSWQPFDAAAPGGSGFCGRGGERPEPKDSAAVAFAIDPDDGPIFGERIEIHAGTGAEKVMKAGLDLDLPCEWAEEDGRRWRMTREEPPAYGDDARLFLVTSLDRPDSFNYEGAMRAGNTIIFFVVNQRTANRVLVDSLAKIAWSRASGTSGAKKGQPQS